MSLKYGLLHAIAGGTSAAARIAEGDVEDERAIARQQSLMDIQRRYAQEASSLRAQQTFSVLQENSDMFPGIEFENSDEVEAALGSGLLPSMLESGKATYNKDLRAQQISQLWQLFPGMQEQFETPEQAVVAAESGVDVTSFINTDSLSDNEANALGALMGVDADTARALDTSGAVAAYISTMGRGGSTPKIVSIRDKNSGTVLEIAENQLPLYLNVLDEAGNPQWETGRVEESDGEFNFVTNTSVTPISRNQVNGGANNLPPRVAARATAMRTWQNNQAMQDLKISHVDPMALTGEGSIDRAVGVWDASLNSLENLSITSDTVMSALSALTGGRSDEATRTGAQAVLTLSGMYTNGRLFFGVDTSRPLAAIMENLARVIPQDLGGIKAMLTSETEVINRLTQYREQIVSGLEMYQTYARTGQDEFGNSIPNDVREEAASKIILGNHILTQVDTFMANSRISSMRVPVKLRGGAVRRVPLTTLNRRNLGALVTEDLTQEEQFYVSMWLERDHLMNMEP